MPDYLPRLVDRELPGLLAQLPALFLTGPRAAGKTTTASRYARTVLHLDRPPVAQAVAADPDAALRDLPEPVLLDEWQVVPEVLGAVKRAVDADSRPGRFLVTGSVRSAADPSTWPGTGRLVRLPVRTLTEREVRRRTDRPLLLDRLAAADVPQVDDSADVRDLVGLALRGGYPDPALVLDGLPRRLWLQGYLEQLLTRDARQLGERRDAAGLRRFFEAYALSTAGVVQDSTLHEAAGVNRRTGLAYEDLLEDLSVVGRLPAWLPSRLKRLVRQPKRLVADASLVGSALGLDADAVLRNGDVLGRLLETFVVAQLQAEAPVAVSQPRLHHLRQEQGRREVDVVVELGGGRVVGLEVKATASPTAADARHLAWLRDELGDRFVMGAVLHTGPRTFELGDRLVALPVAALWS